MPDSHADLSLLRVADTTSSIQSYLLPHNSQNPLFFPCGRSHSTRGKNQDWSRTVRHPLLLSANNWCRGGYVTQFWQMRHKGKFLEVGGGRGVNLEKPYSLII